jgi:ribosomal-protein-alanine N-acetyltransferase
MRELEELRTPRLVLRRWRDEDLDPLAELNTDPETMGLFPAPLTRSESDAWVARMEASFAADGLGMWAVTVGPDGPLVGSVGLLQVTPELPFYPAVETGWRLHRRYWGKGYATEAAYAALRFGFVGAGQREIVAFTAAVNGRSRAVMERLGMRRDPAEDFIFPGIEPDDRLQPHVLYRLGVRDWSREVGRRLSMT